MECFKMLNTVQEMEDIIERFEEFNKTWKSDDLKDFISQLVGIKWQLQHFQKGQSKNLISPYTHLDYDDIKKDQCKINEDTIKKFQ